MKNQPLLHPYDVLQQIETQAKNAALPLPPQESVQRPWLGIGYRSSEYLFVTPLDEIIEVTELTVTTQVPASFPWFKGIGNLRGKLLPITDLAVFVTGYADEKGHAGFEKEYAKRHSHAQNRRIAVLDAPEGRLKGERQDGTNQRGNLSHHKVLIIELKETLLGFLVSEVLGVKKFTKESFKEKEENMGGVYAPYVTGAFILKESSWLILSLKKILNNMAFYHPVQS